MFARATLWLTVLFLAASSLLAQPEPGSWGDQGDGTYKNPVLNGDFPDSDVVQAGDTYYMISSTMHKVPGMIILKSKDLVNWTIIGHVFDKLTWEPGYHWDRMSGYRWGVWAGDLAYHDGRWYCYFIDFKSGLYMTSAKEITGPWEPVTLMLKKQEWTDPAVYWDDDAKHAYLVCNFGKDPQAGDRVNHIRLFKMSWDGRRLLDEGKVIYQGPGAEAAKIERINNKWYIFMAEWRGEGEDRDRKQIVLRSTTDSIYGPYERKVVMERGNGIERSSCQGSILQVAGGSWWFIHQRVQNGETKYIGRPQALEPVTWKDGWPLIGEDVDGDGIGEPVHSGRIPVPGHPTTAPRTGDEFDSPTLGHQWEWNHNPRNDRWSLTERPGYLRLKASVPVNGGGFWNAANTVSQRMLGRGAAVITAKFDVSAMAGGQFAGFAHHSGAYFLCGVRVVAGGDKILQFDDNGESIMWGPRIDSPEIWIRTLMYEDEAQYLYSVDGENFRTFGPAFKVRFGNWKGNRLGFFCWNSEQPEGHIDIDWFHYSYDGPGGDADFSGKDSGRLAPIIR